MEDLRTKASESVESVEEVKKYCIWTLDNTSKLSRLFQNNIRKGKTCSLSKAKEVLSDQLRQITHCNAC
jgi:hypothetical protein